MVFGVQPSVPQQQVGWHFVVAQIAWPNVRVQCVSCQCADRRCRGVSIAQPRSACRGLDLRIGTMPTNGDGCVVVEIVCGLAGRVK